MENASTLLEALMEGALERDASDIHLKVGSPPLYRIDGVLHPVCKAVLTADDLDELLNIVADPGEVERFKRLLELDASYSFNDQARFRVNVSRDDGDVRIVMRTVPMEIEPLESLRLPVVLAKLCQSQNGLVLVTGPTGSGKSTTLAAMVDEINRTRAVHIVTIEDPMEFVHKDQMSIVTQREIGHDTLSFANALRAAMRQDPDVILIGEMRDAETVQTALASAETGHLVLSTLHTVDAVETLNRIIDFFEPHQQIQIRKQLASVLRGVCSQRLVPLQKGSGRVVATEVLIGNRTVRDFIEQGKSFRDIVKLIEDGAEQYGMQTFDQALYTLYKQEWISAQTALMHATSPRDLKLRIQGLRTN